MSPWFWIALAVWQAFTTGLVYSRWRLGRNPGWLLMIAVLFLAYDIAGIAAFSG